MNIHEKLLERKRVEGSRPKLTPEQVTTIRAWFDQHPEQKLCYLFYDGSIEGEDCGFKSRAPVKSLRALIDDPHRPTRPAPPLADTPEVPALREELLMIATRGIPAMIGRGHSQIEETFGISYGTPAEVPAPRTYRLGETVYWYTNERGARTGGRVVNWDDKTVVVLTDEDNVIKFLDRETTEWSSSRF
jgi:hypothetical protein